ncbi:hypothetical protein ABPG74_008200 [Tetrahymena malaccensis]
MDSEQGKNKLDLYVFDFDYTVIEQNSDTIFYTLFENGQPPQELANQYVENQWTAFMNIVLDYLKNKMGVDSSKIKEEIEKADLVGGMKELFEKIKSKDGEIIICSDANSLFIKWIVEKNQIADYFSAIYTNPCTIQNDQLFVKRFYDQHSCPLCTQTPNMCKKKIIEDHIAKNPNKEYVNIHYFGDGKNDFCPMFSLKNQNSTGFVRKGFALEKKIESYLKQENSDPFKCKLVYWKQAHEILNLI